jgi:hypothetical protein
MDPFLVKKSHKHFTFGTRPWDYRLKGPFYKNVRTETNFELLPAQSGKDAPAVFQEAFDDAYGPKPDRPAHPFYEPPTITVGPVLAWAALTHVQKMIEASLTGARGAPDVPDILVAAKSVSYPGAFHQTQVRQTEQRECANSHGGRYNAVDIEKLMTFCLPFIRLC